MRHIITVNTGSSSLKIGLFQAGEDETRQLSGVVDRIGRPGGNLQITDVDGSVMIDRSSHFPNHGLALTELLKGLHEVRPDLKPDAVGHRIVHGGIDYREPVPVTIEFMTTLNSLVMLSPEHLPQAIEAIQVVTETYPDLPQVACFDTAFHRGMPRVAQIYAIPRQLSDEGLVRFGFHGLSYEYVTRQLRSLSPREADGRVVIAHLGNGASMAAVRGGIGIDTTMGFTPNSGLVMGTRSGDVDSGLLIHLLTHRGMKPELLDSLLNKQSGLLGVSGTSADMRDLLGKESTDPNAAEAIALYCYRAKKHLASMAAALGGLDTVIFTGGVGEHASSIRLRICEGLDFLGIRIDSQRNAANASIISTEESPVTVRVINTDEESMIAKAVGRCLKT